MQETLDRAHHVHIGRARIELARHDEESDQNAQKCQLHPAPRTDAKQSQQNVPLGLWQVSRSSRCIANRFERRIGHGLGDFFDDFDLVRIWDRNALLIKGLFDLFGQIKLHVPII